MAKDNSIKKPLSVSLINALKPGNQIKDAGEYTGLNVSCNKIGIKTFFYRYRSPVENRVKRVTLGIYVPTIKDENLDQPLGKKLLGLASARQILVELKAERKAGICPATQLKLKVELLKAEQKAAEQKESRLSVKNIVEVYLRQHIEDHVSTKGKVITGVRKLKGQKETRRTLEAVVGKTEPSEFGALPAEEITHTDIKSLVFRLIDRGTSVQAGRVMNELNLAYNFCIGRPNDDGYCLPEELINPCLQAKEFFKNQRTKLTPKKGSRNLNDSELKKFLEWLPDSGFSLISKHTLMIVLLTGVRSGEATTAEKIRFDLNNGTWFLDATKTDVERYVQLSRQAIEYIRPILENPRNTTPYLLPAIATGKPQNQKQLSQQAWKFRKAGMMLDIAPWTAHDLRRTVRTQLSRLKCPGDVGEAILGHSKKGMEGTYNLHQYEDECKEWLQKWADHLDILLDKVPNVVEFRKRG